MVEVRSGSFIFKLYRKLLRERRPEGRMESFLECGKPAVNVYLQKSVPKP